MGSVTQAGNIVGACHSIEMNLVVKNRGEIQVFLKNARLEYLLCKSIIMEILLMVADTCKFINNNSYSSSTKTTQSNNNISLLIL
jgi:hypothetical protein